MTPDRLSEIHARCFPNARNWTADEFSSLLSKPVSLLREHPYGFALGQVIAPECELQMIAILPEHRKKGAGQDLLAKFLGDALSRGARQCVLEFDADDAGLSRFYTKAGFSEIRTIKDYYSRIDGTKSDAKVMSRTLFA